MDDGGPRRGARRGRVRRPASAKSPASCGGLLPALRAMRESDGTAPQADDRIAARRTGTAGPAGRFRDRARGRPRRHGRGLRGGADFAGPARGAEGAAVRRHARSAKAAALPERGAGGGLSAPRQHRAGLRRRLRSRRPLLRHAVHRGPQSRRPRSRHAPPGRAAGRGQRSKSGHDGTARAVTANAARGDALTDCAGRRPFDATLVRAADVLPDGRPSWRSRRPRRCTMPIKKASFIAT